MIGSSFGDYPPNRIDPAQAACRTERALFFPDRSVHTPEDAKQMIRQAKQICTGCTQRQACYEFIMALPAKTPGVWAGTSMKDRREIRAAKLRHKYRGSA